MTEFNYRRIGQDFLRELVKSAANGDSAVLLGPRDIGKRYVFHRLPARLEEAGMPTVPVELGGDDSFDSPKAICGAIAHAARIRVEGGAMCVPLEASDQMFEALDYMIEQAHAPVVFIVANVDSLPHHLARKFLQGIRTRVEARKLVALLSGEDDLRGLVHGPNSEFNCARLYVVQGFDRPEFDDCLSKRLRVLNCPTEAEEAAKQRLFEITGGNIHLLRPLLWAWVDELAKDTQLVGKAWRVDTLTAWWERTGRLDLFGLDPFRHAVRFIKNEPESWPLIESLLCGDEIETVSSLPYPLELAGVAVREHSKLRFASLMTEKFLKRFLDTRRWGDLHARHGRWQRAFSYFQELSHERTLRPTDADDWAEVGNTVHALCTGLHAAATASPATPDKRNHLREFFQNGCRWLLGFSDVSFWRRTQKDGWRPTGATQTSEALSQAASRILPGEANLSLGWRPVGEPLASKAVLAVLPAIRKDEYEAVIVGDFGTGFVISREREQLVRQLIDHFVVAYLHATLTAVVQVQLERRNRYAEILGSIYDALTRSQLDGSEWRIQEAMATAASGLRPLGYRRVLFCMVDATGQYIVGMKDDSDDPSFDVAHATNYALNDPMRDIQPYVIHTKKPFYVFHAREEPLTNKDVVARARMESLAVVPILNHHEHAIGTIHVERVDGDVPCSEEVLELMNFGRSLATAVELCERTSLLKFALDLIREPMVVTDRHGRVRYANKAAHNLLGVKAAWCSGNDCQGIREFLEHEPFQNFQKSLDCGERTVRILPILNKDGIKVKCEVVTDCILEQQPKGQVVGGLLHILDYDYVLRVFDAFEHVAEAKDPNTALEAVLEAIRNLGHRWARLYLIDQNQGGFMVGRRSFNLDDPAQAEEFNRGAVALPSQHPSASETWRTISEKEPLVFLFEPDMPDGTIIYTSRGLRGITVQKPLLQFELNKKAHSYWIDIPLFLNRGSGTEQLGKITMECREDFEPENFEILRVLSTMFNAMLGVMEAKQKMECDRERWILSAAERAMADASHNVVSRLAPLSVYLSLYRSHEKARPQLRELNNDFSRVVTGVQTATKRIKERLAGVVPDCSRTNLTELIQMVCHSALPTEQWELHGPTEPVHAYVDMHLLGDVFHELIHNSRKAVRPQERLRVILHLRGRATATGDWIEIHYCDNGPGIAAELKERVFENFFSHWPGQKTGTGLGLGYVRRVCEAHCGSVEEKGKLGDGVDFVIKLRDGPEGRTY